MEITIKGFQTQIVCKDSFLGTYSNEYEYEHGMLQDVSNCHDLIKTSMYH